MEANNINPSWDDLCNPATIINHIEELKKKPEGTPHSEILHQLKKQLEKVDFEAMAFPQVKKLKEQLEQLDPGSEQATEIRKQLNRIKVSAKHYRILAVRNISKVAIQNRWGLCKKHDSIYLFNGAFWAELEKEEFQLFLGEAAEKMGIRWDYFQDYHFREHLFKQFISTEYLSTPQGDKSKVLINLLNGTFEISPKGTILRPFDRSDFITYQLPFEYNPQATAPLFEAYLNRVLPDKERQRVLAEFIGFVFVKRGSNRIKEEKALILYGSGANGKSVFFEIITAMFGSQNVSNYSLQSLTEEKGFYRAKISNKLINYASEINGKLETSLFKQMTSGEPVEACLKYGQPFTMTDYAKFIFNCNELPKDVEHTNAYFRRFLIIPFDVTIPPEEQDKNLHTKIIENELSGVFNWALNGLNRLLEQEKFSACDAAQKAVEQYKLESDSVQLFLAENGYSVSTSTETALKEMFSEYRNYCLESGFKPCSLRTLADRLRNSGYRTERKNYGTVVFAEKKIIF
jgi:putative DNA primase/helicase